MSTAVLARMTLMRVGGREGLRQLESVNTKSCGAFSRGSAAAMLAVGFLSSKSSWVQPQSSLLRSLMGSSVMKAVEVHSIHKGY